MRPEKLVVRLRFGVFLVMLLVTGGLLAASRNTSGYSHDSLQYLIVVIVQVGLFLIPSYLFLDLVFHLAVLPILPRGPKGHALWKAIGGAIVGDGLLLVLGWFLVLIILEMS